MVDNLDMIQSMKESVETAHNLLIQHVKSVNDFHTEGRASMAKIEAIHSQSLIVSQNVPFLQVLPEMAASMREMKNSVLAAAIGSNRIPSETVKDIIKTNNRTYIAIILVLLVLLLIIMAFFTGLAVSYPDIFKALRGIL